jgi:hypothetical protein
MGLFDTKFTGHSMKRPPKKCSVCRKPLTSQAAGIKWSEREARKDEYCQCERCLHNILEGDRKPWVCDECKAKSDAEQ